MPGGFRPTAAILAQGDHRTVADDDAPVVFDLDAAWKQILRERTDAVLANPDPSQA